MQYAQQTPIGVTAGTKACCFLVLHNSSQPQGRALCSPQDAVQDTVTQSGLYAQHKAIGVTAGTKPAVFWLCTAAGSQGAGHFAPHGDAVHFSFARGTRSKFSC